MRVFFNGTFWEEDSFFNEINAIKKSNNPSLISEAMNEVAASYLKCVTTGSRMQCIERKTLADCLFEACKRLSSAGGNPMLGILSDWHLGEKVNNCDFLYQGFEDLRSISGDENLVYSSDLNKYAHSDLDEIEQLTVAWIFDRINIVKDNNEVIWHCHLISITKLLPTARVKTILDKKYFHAMDIRIAIEIILGRQDTNIGIVPLLLQYCYKQGGYKKVG